MGKVNVMGEQSGRGSVKGGSREGWVMGSGRARVKSGAEGEGLRVGRKG
jgi:hypothetical protein